MILTDFSQNRMFKRSVNFTRICCLRMVSVLFDNSSNSYAHRYLFKKIIYPIPDEKLECFKMAEGACMM